MRRRGPRKHLTKGELNRRSIKNHGCSARVWSNAKKRKAKYFGENLWLVWGGENPHRVYFTLSLIICDCGLQKQATNHVCCHIQAIKNYLYALVEQHKKSEAV